MSQSSCRAEVDRRVGDSRLIAVLRRVPPERLDLIVDILGQAGVRLAEVTWDSSDAPRLLRRAVARSNGSIVWGAGTVITVSQVQAASDAGAAFIVSPSLVPDVVRATREAGLYSVPGAFSPSEILNAHQMGADLVKVFPAATLGPAYFSELSGPFPDVPLAAVGGITPGNAAAYLRAGARAVAAGSALVRRDLLEAGDRQGLLHGVVEFVEAVRAVRKGGAVE